MFLNEDNSENKSVVHIDAKKETFVQKWYIMELRQSNTVGLSDPIPLIFPNFLMNLEYWNFNRGPSKVDA